MSKYIKFVNQQILINSQLCNINTANTIKL